MKLSLFIPKKFSSKTTFIPQPLSSKTTFIPTTLSSRSSTQRDTTIVGGSLCRILRGVRCGHHFTADRVIGPSHWEDWGCTALCSCSVLDQLGRLCSHGEQAPPSDLQVHLEGHPHTQPLHHVEGVTISEAALRLSGFHPPSWEVMAQGDVPPKRRTGPNLVSVGRCSQRASNWISEKTC